MLKLCLGFLVDTLFCFWSNRVKLASSVFHLWRSVVLTGQCGAWSEWWLHAANH